MICVQPFRYGCDIAKEDIWQHETPAGDPIVPQFEMDDDTGELVQVGTINVDDVIQTYKDDVNLAVLISRAANGDPTALNRKAGAFIDSVDMPKSLLDAQRMAAFSADVFASLPDDLRERIKSAEDLEAAIVDGSLAKALGGDAIESIDERLSRLEAAARVQKGGDSNE